MLSTYDVSNPVWGVPASSGRNLTTMMDRLFQDFETAFRRPPEQRSARPRLQMRDLGDSMLLVVDLPGCELSDIDLGIEGDVLSLRVSPPKDTAIEGFTPIHLERSRSGGQWALELPYPVNVEGTQAILKQGRLEVTLPKAPEAVPRRISVRAV